MSSEPYSLEVKWVQVAVIAGLIASVDYPVMIATASHVPRILTLILGSAFGPSLAIASMGLYYFLKAEGERVAAQIAVVANVVAGAFVTGMIIVQLAIQFPQLDYIARSGADPAIQTIIRWTWFVVLGLDVSFDVFLAIGTFCFALLMLKHPRFGKTLGTAGFLIVVPLLVGLKFYTFPYPPKDVGFTIWDPGPWTDLWYLAVTIQLWRSLKWFRVKTQTIPL
jgi:hypothetical protein